MATRKSSGGKNARSSVSGRYVTKKFAAAHPRTTELEARKPGKKKK